jgi:putative ABC transport system substrate-binding protein
MAPGVVHTVILTFALLAVLALGVLTAADAGAQKQIGVVGVLLPASLSPTTTSISGELARGLRDLGWVEGQNLAIEYRWAGGRLDRLPELAADLVARKVDVIVAGGELAIRAARQATSTIPIVMAISGDPVGTGLVASLARPGGNVTGLSMISPELATKRLQLLKETVPGVSRVAVVWNPAIPAKALDWKHTQAAAGSLAITLQSVEVLSATDIEPVLSELNRSRLDAAILFAETFDLQLGRRLMDLALSRRLPLMAEPREYAAVGAVMAYGVAHADLFRQSAGFVDKILRGARPADLPVEQPTRVQLVVNLRTARALGLTIPPSVLARADEIIE